MAVDGTHTPFDRVGEDPAVVHAGRVLYCHSPLFGAYRRHAVPYYRELVGALLDRLAPEHVLSAGDLPTTAEVSLLRQRQDDRTILHVVHAVPQRRGEGVDVVEHVLPLYSVRVGVRMERPATHVFLAPQGQTLPHETVDDVTWTTVPEIRGHQVVVFA